MDMSNFRRFIVPVLAALLCGASCNQDEFDPVYRQRMREFVVGISDYSESLHQGFIVIPQNGIELVSDDGEEDGPASTAFLEAIDANGQEDLFYGYERDDRATPVEESDYMISFLNISKESGNTILVTDYCSTQANMEDSYRENEENGFVSFAASHRELNNIPSYPSLPNNHNSDAVGSIDKVKNFLYLINPEDYSSKATFIQALSATDYDLLILDLFFNDDESLTATDLAQIKTKNNGGSRLVVAYMSIGEAEDYRYYWQDSWSAGDPSWLDRENPQWEGNYKVKYWDPGWQSIIYGNDESYLKRIIDAGFDGVYLDIIEAFEYYE